MKKIFLLPALIICIGSVYAETISLTCMGKDGRNEASGNYTIVVPSPHSRGKIYIQDKDLESKSDSGISIVKEIVVTESEIRWSADYQGFPKTYSEPQFHKPSNNGKDEWVIDRATGEMTRTSFYSPQSLTTRIMYSQCELRKANKL